MKKTTLIFLLFPLFFQGCAAVNNSLSDEYKETKSSYSDIVRNVHQEANGATYYAITIKNTGNTRITQVRYYAQSNVGTLYCEFESILPGQEKTEELIWPLPPQPTSFGVSEISYLPI